MAKAVFIQNPVSIYDDRPGEAYHFPKRYLGMVRETIGDWVVLYESKKSGGAFGYVGVQKVLSVTADPVKADHFFAWYDTASALQFEDVVPRGDANGIAHEVSLRHFETGVPISGGISVSAVRRLTESEFASIVNSGLEERTDAYALPREGVFEDAQQPFIPKEEIVRESVLTNRKIRDRAFRGRILRAYQGRCAISGMDLRNGGGRAEVQAAHIKAVEDGGPDIVQNGLALSGTLHWMFDRGLIAVGDNHEILVSDNKVSPDISRRLISSDRKLHLPDKRSDWPHPAYLKHHRETRFGMTDAVI
ncbi:HNH endonuclease [Nereida sp. MMG025]|uniref:HNH endonuclease n=1 Tax=Nereida sp. MMG025 TaxID=2909981 RepID=UPI001F432BE2|nr:HNH endonuclease [Nereida sp. MMG025]MCF6444873.1 HNH endonuclease [Nereida sp. MMG025]